MMKQGRKDQEQPVSLATPKRSHALIMAALSLLCGCLCAPALSQGLWLWALLGIGALLFWVLHQLRLPAYAGLCLCVFTFGVLYAQTVYHVPLPPEGKYEITGFVSGKVTQREDNRLTFVLDDITLDGLAVSPKAYCSLHYEEEAPVLYDGALLRFSGSVYHPDGKSGEPHFDFRMWMLQNGHPFGIAIYDEVFLENTPQNAPAIDSAYRLQQLLGSILQKQLGENSRAAMALLFGESSGLSQDEYDAFQTLGIAHVMSVSGLHVSLLGGLLSSLLMELRMRKQLQLLVLTGFLLFYCWLTGFAAPAVRAAAMLLLYLLCRLALRSPDRLTLLASSMIAVLLLQPLHAHSSGFVLSFSAMIGIFLCANPMERWLDSRWKPLKHLTTPTRQVAARLQQTLKSTLCLSCSAQLGVLLPTMAYFHQLPLYGVVINLLIVPLTSLLLPLYVLCLLPFLPIGGVVSVLTDGLLSMVQLLSRLPFAAIRTGSPSALVCIGLGLAAMLLSRRMPGTSRRRIQCSVIIAALALIIHAAALPPSLRYIQLSVGQADAALLLDGNKTIVIDTGNDGTEVLDYLLDENREIDTLILTHLHADHAGGVMTLLENGIRIHEICVPVHAHKQQIDEELQNLWNRILDSGIPVIPLASGDELRYNRSIIRVLWPGQETTRSGHDANDYSLVLSIDLDGYTLLCAGDVPGYYENYAAVPADVLKAAHHGSANSTSEAFLRHVSPTFALLSTSGRGHLPSEAVLSRLDEQGIRAFRTDLSGDITLSVENGRLTLSPFLSPFILPLKELLP